MNTVSAVIVAGWIIFWLYWFFEATKSKKSIHRGASIGIGVRLALIVIVLIFVGSNHDRSYHFNSDSGIHSLAIRIIGLVIFILGLSLAIWARVYLSENWGMPMSQKEHPELVTTGPYKYIRHPIYTGFLIAVIGSILGISPYWLVVLFVSGGYFIYSAFKEEQYMTREFPRVYKDYKKRTKMLIPFIL